MEYIIIVSFITFILITTLGIAVFYSGTIKDKIKITQINNLANKIVSTAESVYYYGTPSKATVSVYLPDGVDEIEISENTLFITSRTSTGTQKSGFSSKVPIQGTINSVSGVKKIEITAQENYALIEMAN